MTASAIRTERLVLRGLGPDDANWIAREIAVPEVQRWLTNPPHPFALTHAQEFIAHNASNPACRAILLGDEPVGVVSITAREDSEPDLGYWLKTSAWGRGLMSEAVRNLLDWYWPEFGGPVISGWVEGNRPSANVLRKLGFRETAPRQEFSQFHGAAVTVRKARLDHWGPEFSLATDRLVLDGLTDADLDVVHAEWGDPGIARMVASVTPNWPRDEARAWLLSRRPPSEHGFGCAIRLPGGKLIGSVGIGGEPRRIGYLLGRRHWGYGYATEAVGAFCRRAFDHLPDIDHIEAQVFDDNAGSVAVLEKTGFRRVSPTDCSSKGRVEKSPASLYRVRRSDVKARP